MSDTARHGIRDLRGIAQGALGVLVAVLFPILVGACASGGAGGAGASEDRSGPPPDRFVSVHIRNNNWQVIHFYVQSDAGTHRSLGVLSTGDTATYQVTPRIIGGTQELRLIADPVGGGRAFASEGILFNWGNRITWNVQQPLVHSSVFVR